MTFWATVLYFQLLLLRLMFVCVRLMFASHASFDFYQLYQDSRVKIEFVRASFSCTQPLPRPSTPPFPVCVCGSSDIRCTEFRGRSDSQPSMLCTDTFINSFSGWSLMLFSSSTHHSCHSNPNGRHTQGLKQHPEDTCSPYACKIILIAGQTYDLCYVQTCYTLMCLDRL